MLHQWICRGGVTPHLESLGLGSKLIKALSVALLVCALLAPKPAAAAYASTLQTLYDAINGNVAAQSQLATDLGVPPWVDPGYCTGAPPSPINWFLANVTSALGGTSAALSIVQGAINLNAGNTETLQNAVGGSFFFNLSFYNCPDGGMGWYTGNHLPQFTNGYDQLINTIIAGQAANSYVTIINALNGQPGAIKTLDTVLYHMIPGYGAVNHTTFLDALTDFVGTTTGTAATDNFTTGVCPASTGSFTLGGTPVSLDSTRVTLTANDSFAGDGINNSYLSTFAPSPLAVIQKNGATLSSPADYTVAGNTITFAVIPSTTDIITLSDNITEYNNYASTGSTTYTVGFPLGPVKPTVTVNGVVQPPANYTIAGSVVTFIAGIPLAGTNVVISNYSVAGTTLTFNNAPGCGYAVQAAYTTGLGGGGTVAATLALFTAGLGGDTTSNNQINVIISNILSSNAASAPPLFIANGLDFVTSVPANPGGIIDTDGDGLPDSIDPDIDGDGTTNDADVCPMDPTNVAGCSGTPANPDTDGDGIPDIVDSTPGGSGTVTGPPTAPVLTNPGGAVVTGSGSSSPPKDECGKKSATLTSDFGVDPCDLTEDNLNLTGNSNYWAEGGKQFADHLDKWWTNQFEPALKNMTAQLNASRVDQSRQMGSTMDSHNVTKAATTVQVFEKEDKANLEPNERTCVAGSFSAPLANEDYTGKAISKGFIFDTQTRQTGGPSAPTPKPPNADVDLKNQFDTYCKFFDTPSKGNAGHSPCPTPTTGALPNGDIEVENFILKDTIDLKKPEEYAAAHAFLTHIVQPRMVNPISPEMLETAQGKQYILERQHVDAMRNLAASVVAGIISRRAAIPLPKEAGGTAPLPPASTPPPPPAAPPPAAGSSGDYTAFLAALAQRESSGDPHAVNGPGYIGLYQFGELAMRDVGCYNGGALDATGDNNDFMSTNWTGICSGISSKQEFMDDTALQTAAVKKLMQNNYNYIGASLWNANVCKVVGGILMTPSGMLAGAHLVGWTGVKHFLQSGGAVVDRDGNKVPVTQYMQMFQGYTVPFGSTQCAGNGTPYASSTATGTPPPPPKPVGQTIYDIRHRAGIPDSEIAKNPSYNEIMLALTKERFFDPDYYARMGTNLGSIKQEQSAVKAYISLQLQDIYMMQEQINSLLAAKAAMTYDKEKSNHSENAPVR